MRQTCRSARELSGLLSAIAALALMVATLGALAVRAEKPNTAQTPAAGQTPSATVAVSPTPTPSPTPTTINLSSDPTLKRSVFGSIGPATMSGRIDDISCVDGNPYICYICAATGR